MQLEVRLQKYLAQCGIASRRKSEDLILKGMVQVNNETITKLGVKINPEKDVVTINGKVIKPEPEKVYIMLNKPKGYITTVKEQFNRPSIMDLLKGVKQRIFPVGRLDKDTSGLLLLTNDGEFAYTLTHPKHHIKKKYIAEIKGVPDNKSLDKFKKGLKIENYITSPAEIRVVSKKKKSSIVEIVIYEGRNRQIRKMCEAIGHPVISLHRTAIGGLELKDLPEGKWRYLSKDELKLIYSNKS